MSPARFLAHRQFETLCAATRFPFFSGETRYVTLSDRNQER